MSPIAEETEGPVRVACLGGSITFGLGLANRRQECYPAVLQRMLGEAALVRNFGYSGAAVGRQTNEPYTRTPSFQAAERFRPEVCVVMLGTNDAQHANAAVVDRFADELNALLDLLGEWETAPRVMLALPPPVFPPHAEISISTLDTQIRPALAQAAADRRLPLIDAFTPLAGCPHWFPDRLHPDADGAVEIAKQVEAALRGDTGRLAKDL